MNPRNAAHLCDVAAAGSFDCPVMLTSEFGAAVEAAICAIFLANRSLSPKSIFSRRFMAPGRLFMLFRRMIFTWSLASVPAVLPCPGVSSSGSAPASESSVATSFLFGRRRLALLDEGLVILDINAACLICRLSLLVDGKSDEPKVKDSTRCDEDDEDFFRADFSCLGALCSGA